MTKLAARRLTSHSQGPGQRLVEVVDVEDQMALGRGEDAEVHEMAIAADLDVEARGRRGCEVGGHDRGGAAIEGEGRLAHAAIANRDEMRHAMSA